MTPEVAFSAYLAALRVGDRPRALEVVDQAREGGLGIHRLYVDVFQPALYEIGRLWQQSQITVGEEHLATAITQVAMARLYTDLFDVDRNSGPTVIGACAVTENHQVGLQMVCDLLELEGWDTVFLGASVPQDSLTAMVEKRRPEVVALSASLAPHLPQLSSMIDEVKGSLGPARPFFVVGGRLLVQQPDLSRRLGADLTARNAVETVERLEEKFR